MQVYPQVPQRHRIIRFDVKLDTSKLQKITHTTLHLRH